MANIGQAWYVKEGWDEGRRYLAPTQMQSNKGRNLEVGMRMIVAQLFPCSLQTCLKEDSIDQVPESTSFTYKTLCPLPT